MKAPFGSDRPRPKLIVMSATLEADKFAAFFAANVYTIPGRIHAVNITYCDLITKEEDGGNSYVRHAVSVVMDIHTKQVAGDVLVFLTGQAEIEHACRVLYESSETLDYRYDVEDLTVNGLMILPVFGNLPTDVQQRVFKPAPLGIRKIILATDIASTSLTIDGIVYVVDSGFVKQKTFNAVTGLDTLQVHQI